MKLTKRMKRKAERQRRRQIHLPLMVVAFELEQPLESVELAAVEYVYIDSMSCRKRHVVRSYSDKCKEIE
jgi:hypothetical protein